MNLNHLVALDALLAERSVGRAAARLGITQSAMSHTLRSLRELTGDPLLVRTGNAMVLTPFAEQAKGRLQRGLSELESVVSGRAAFDPSTIGDMFTLATHDGVAAMLAAPLRAELKRRAPSATLRIQPAESSVLRSSLESGDVDVLALPPVLDLDGLEHEQLPDAPRLRSFSVVCRREHPKIDKRLSLAQYCNVPHVVASISGGGPSFIDHLLAERGRQRRVEAYVPYLLAMAEMVSSSDLVGTLPTAVCEFFCARWPMKMFPLPLQLEGGPLVLWWHPRFSADPAHRFFRETIRAATEVAVRVAQGKPRRSSRRRGGLPGARDGMTPRGPHCDVGT